MANPLKFDVLVIGSGILGTFHAYHALRAGYSVGLIEKNKKPQGATTRNFGQVVPSGLDTKWQKIGRRSLEIYKELQQETDISLQSNGSVYIASDNDEVRLIEELALQNQKVGYPSKLLTKTECLQKWPVLQPSYCQAGLFFPQEISLDPRITVHKIINYMIEKMGLKYFPSCQITQSLVLNRGVEFRSSDQRTFVGEKGIICNGSEFQTLYPELFGQSDLEVSKLHMLRTTPNPKLRIKGNILTGRTIRRYESFRECNSYKDVRESEPKDTFAKKYGIHILLTQAPDGTIVLGDSHEYADAKNKDALGYEIDQSINVFMLREAKKIFRIPNLEIQNTWFGLYSQCKTKDIFQHNIGGCLHIVTGIGGKGMTAGPGFAEKNLKLIL